MLLFPRGYHSTHQVETAVQNKETGQKSFPPRSGQATTGTNVPLGYSRQVPHRFIDRPAAYGSHCGYDGPCGLQPICGFLSSVLDGNHYDSDAIAPLPSDALRPGTISPAQHAAASGDRGKQGPEQPPPAKGHLHDQVLLPGGSVGRGGHRPEPTAVDYRTAG